MSEEEGYGHTLREHVGKTDEQMLQRVRASRSVFPLVTYGFRRDGSFESAESADDFVNRTLEKNSSQVDLVASGKEKYGSVTHRFGYKTGREAYTAGYLEPYMRSTYSVGIFIVHDPSRERGYSARKA